MYSANCHLSILVLIYTLVSTLVRTKRIFYISRVMKSQTLSFQTKQPNQQDLLRLRKKTTGIREEVYEIKGVHRSGVSFKSKINRLVATIFI